MKNNLRILKFYVLIHIILVLPLKGLEVDSEEDEDYEMGEPLEPMSFSGSEIERFKPIIDKATFLENFSKKESEIPIVSKALTYFRKKNHISKEKLVEFLASLMQEVNLDEEREDIINYIHENILIGELEKEFYSLENLIEILGFKEGKNTDDEIYKNEIDL